MQSFKHVIKQINKNKIKRIKSFKNVIKGFLYDKRQLNLKWFLEHMVKSLFNIINAMIINKIPQKNKFKH